MPRGDRTGPVGMGAMTGRGAGFCAGFGFMNPGNVYGMGFGKGCGGRGFGRRFGFSGSPTEARFAYPAFEENNASVADEKEYLDYQTKILQKQLEKVKKRLEALDGVTE